MKTLNIIFTLKKEYVILKTESEHQELLDS